MFLNYQTHCDQLAVKVSIEYICVNRFRHIKFAVNSIFGFLAYFKSLHTFPLWIQCSHRGVYYTEDQYLAPG